MDYKKYYKLDHGGYTLHFKNNNRYSVEEIRKIFSRFGNVVNVNVTDQEDGYRFVRFKTLNEVQNCLEGLKDNDKIIILPERKYMNKMDKNSRPKQEGSTNKEAEGNFEDNKIFSEAKFQKGTTAYNTKIFNCNGTDSFLNTNSQKGSYDCKSNEDGAYNKQDVLVFKEKHSLPQDKNFNDNSLSERINYEKFYKKLKDGSYAVHFANRNKLNHGEITEIFSEYGMVLSVSTKGENTGLIHIRYKYLNDVISCLKGLQNNNLINILFQKDKKYSNQLLENPHNKTLNERQVNSFSTFDETSLETVGKQTHDIKNSNWKNDSNNSWDTVSQNSKCNYKPNTMKYEKPGSSIIKSELHSSPMTDGNIYINKTIFDNKTSNLNFANRQEEFNEISDFSVPQLFDAKDASSKKVIQLQEIIIANIHEDYGIHYILHLLEKYDPVSATFVKIIPKNKIRYCSIFFKAITDAIAVEKEFDNYVLFGKKLIVLRKSRLMEEALYE